MITALFYIIPMVCSFGSVNDIYRFEETKRITNNKVAILFYLFIFAIHHKKYQHEFSTRNRLKLCVFFQTQFSEAWAEARITMPLDRITC